MKKALSIIIALTMLISCCALAFSVSAETGTIVDGYCGAEGKNLTWSLDTTTGELTISGSGEMKDYWNFDATPWYPYDLSNIKKIIITDGVTSIGNCAFACCYDLKNIVIPPSISLISDDAFAESTLDSIYITDITSWCNIDFNDNLFSFNTKLYLNSELVTDLQIPNTVTVIKSGAFTDYNQLKYVTISNSVTTIESHAFYNCQNIENITIGSGVQSIGEYAFAFCNSLSSIIIPNNVTLIEYGAFWDCIGLQQITIGNGIKTIDGDAFSYCESIESIYITDLKAWFEINFSSPESNPLYYADYLYLNNELVTEVTLPDEVTTIKDYAFYNYYRLKDIILHDNITSISPSAFSNCNNLPYNKYDNAYYLGNTDNPYISLMYVTDNDINSIQIHPSTKIINVLAFDNCDNLTTVNIPNGVKIIGNQAFVECSNLISVTIPQSVIKIDDGAFGFCGKLSSITIPNEVTSIGKQAFAYCRKLTSIVIGNKVTDIGVNAFVQCDSLEKVYIHSNDVSLMITDRYSPEYLLTNVKTLLFGAEITSITDYVKNNYEYKGISYENGTEYLVYSKVNYTLTPPSYSGGNPEQNGSTPQQNGENSGSSSNEDNNSTSNSNSATTDSIISSTDNKDGETTGTHITTSGCGSSLFGNVALMTIATLGAIIILKKKKQSF